jgi:hypothetical protein
VLATHNSIKLTPRDCCWPPTACDGFTNAQLGPSVSLSRNPAISCHLPFGSPPCCLHCPSDLRDDASSVHDSSASFVNERQQ